MALAVLVAACSKTRPLEAPAEAKAECERCHGYPPQAGSFITAGPDTRVHPDNQNCHLCHPGTVEEDNKTIVPGGLHMNGTVEAAGHAQDYVGTHGPDALAFLGGGAGSCTTCHTDFGAGSTGKSCNECHAAVATSAPSWQTNCTFCHGTPTAGVTAVTTLVAPPESVLGADAASDARVGAHQAHLAAGEFANAFACTTCHTVPTDALRHFAGYGPTSSVVPAFDAFASTGMTGGATYAGGTCATYCHGSGTEFANPANHVSPAWNAGSGAASCGTCHGTPPASGPMIGTQSAHELHVAKGATCATCHEGYTETSVALATHVNGAKEVKYLGAAITTGWTNCNTCHQAGNVAIHAIPFGDAHEGAALADISSCTTCHGATYGGGEGRSCNGCHAAIAASAPDWKTNCTFCHGTRTANATSASAAAAPPDAVLGGDATIANPKVGAHQKHLVAGTFSAPLACASCHDGLVPTGADALSHFAAYDGSQADVAFSALAGTGVTGGAAYAGGTCATYCHGSGTEFTNPSGKVSPAWTSTGLACGDCHGTPPASGPTIGSQNAHAFHGSKGATCATCHGAGYSTIAVNTATHVNGTKDVVANQAWDCSACHTALDVQVAHPLPFEAGHTSAALASIGSCTVCHGSNYGGGTAQSCTACHVTRGLAGGAEWTTNCAFCHGTRTAGVTAATALAAPPESVLGAGGSSDARVGAHQAHLTTGEFANAFACATCHTVPTDALGHFDGWAPTSSVVPAFDALAGAGVAGGAAYAGNGGTCATYCHGSGTQFTNPSGQASPAWTSTALACGDCHGTPPASGPAIGSQTAHDFHVAKGATCGTCHQGYTGTSAAGARATHVNGVKDVTYLGAAVTTGWTDCNTCHQAGNVAVHAIPYGDAHKAGALASIASCTSCHGASYEGGDGPSCNACHAGVATSAPDWKTNCTFCHGTKTPAVVTATATAAPPQAIDGTATDQTSANPRVGAHQRHLVAGTFSPPLPCQSCHAVPAQAQALTHFDGYDGSTADVAFSALAATGMTGAAYAGNGGTCATYCHGSGSAFANPPGQASPAWASSGLACGDCHGTPPSSGPTLSGQSAHEFHLAKNTTCDTCHPGYSPTQVVLATHVNGTKDVKAGNQPIQGWDCGTCHAALGVGHPMPYVAQHTGPALADIASCAACHGADYAGIAGVSPSCNACHATNVTASAPDWKTNCTFCHGARTQDVTTATAAAAPPQAVLGGDATPANPKVGAHQAHLTAGAYALALPCESCHPVADQTDALTHFTGYAGGQADIAFDALASKGAPGTYAGSGGTCAVYCHGAGTQFTNPVAASPAWNAPAGTTVTCGTCHALPPQSGPAYPAPNAHDYHVATLALACGTCHANYTASSVDVSTHVNGAKDVVVAGGTRITGWDCNACHAALGAPLMHAMPFVADHTPAAIANLTGCTDCHGADYAGGTVGVSCNDCHLSAVPNSAPDWKTNCTFCHGTRTAGWTAAQRNLPAPPEPVAMPADVTTTNPRVGAHQRHTLPAGAAGLTLSIGFACTECHPSVTSLSHVGRGPQAALQPGPIASANGTPTSLSSATCTTYCHGASMPGTGRAAPTWAPPAPSGTALNCGSCHQANPTTGQHPAVQADHEGFACSTCHGAGYGTTAVTGAARTTHVNGAKTMSSAASVGWTTTPTKGCAALCHYPNPDGSPTFHPW